ncbi:MAG: peptidoglycan editing factor PgeF [Patescibacteria group bacterium]
MTVEKYISKQSEGSMNKQENIAIFLTKKGIDPSDFIRAELVHGKEVKVVGEDQKGEIIKETDGLITTDKNIALGVTVADCLPIYLHSEKFIGILHAGWKSLEKEIIPEAINKIKKIGEDPKNIKAYIGPSIQVCHFEVKEDLVEKFSDYKNCFEKKDEKIFLNLQKIAKNQLNSYGVNNIKDSNKCTYCNQKFFSYRRDKEINNMLAVITNNKNE